MDLPNKFKVTLTGPNAIGNKNPRNVSAKQKSLDPSHIGILSLDVCGSSNPGMSNYFNFLCETDGTQFKGRPPEPETFGLEWFRIRMRDEGFDPEGNQVFGLSFSDPIKFNNMMDVYDDFSIHARSKEETSLDK